MGWLPPQHRSGSIKSQNQSGALLSLEALPGLWLCLHGAETIWAELVFPSPLQSLSLCRAELPGPGHSTGPLQTAVKQLRLEYVTACRAAQVPANPLLSLNSAVTEIINTFQRDVNRESARKSTHLSCKSSVQWQQDQLSFLTTSTKCLSEVWLLRFTHDCWPKCPTR